MYQNVTDLLRQIRLGENSVLELKNVEFSGNKVSAPHTVSMADELATRANTASGILILGVDDKTREIKGIESEKPDILARMFQQRSQTRLNSQHHDYRKYFTASICTQ